jgi:hypothetical protein
MADLTQQINELMSKGTSDLAEPDRLALLQASTKLAEALENPFEKLFRLLLVSIKSEVFSLSSCLFIQEDEQTI